MQGRRWHVWKKGGLYVAEGLPGRRAVGMGGSVDSS